MDPLHVDPHAPWDLIRWVQRQAPYWKIRVESTSRSLVEIPRKGGDSSSGRLAPAQVNYLDLQRAVSEMGYQHPHGARLRLIVEMRMEGDSERVIAGRLRVSRSLVRKSLDDAYYWLCHPEGGRFLPKDVWEEAA